MVKPLDVLALSTGGWFGLFLFAAGVYMTLFAFGWLPAALSQGHDHPVIKTFRWFGPVQAVVGFFKFLFASQ